MSARVQPKAAARPTPAKVAPKAATTKKFELPFTRKNYMFFGLAFVVLLIGYICLAQPPADGFLSRTFAPILLMLAYCVIIPYAIMARERSKQPAPTVQGD
jgi:hypothetical protein